MASDNGADASSGPAAPLDVRVTLQVLAGSYAVSQLPPQSPIPDWADGAGFVSIARTSSELSIVCLEDRVAPLTRSEAGWRCFQFVGPFAFDQTGIASAVLKPLAEAQIGIFLVSTFDTDYLFIKTQNAGRAAEILTAAGHVVTPASA